MMNKTALYGWVLSAMVTTQLLSPQASARTIVNAKIIDIKVGYYADANVGVTVTGGTSSGSIGCTPSSGFNTTFLFNTDQGSGRTTLSVLLAAYLAGKTVDLIGTSACTTIFLKGASGETKTAEELGHSIVKN
jgi:hypothetical protein